MFTSSCKSFRYWDGRPEGRSGVCRCSPPRSLTFLSATEEPELRVIWPTTLADDRCGAFRGPEIGRERTAIIALADRET
jgi:hypothetical protein